MPGYPQNCGSQSVTKPPLSTQNPAWQNTVAVPDAADASVRCSPHPSPVTGTARQLSKIRSCFLPPRMARESHGHKKRLGSLPVPRRAVQPAANSQSNCARGSERDEAACQAPAFSVHRTEVPLQLDPDSEIPVYQDHLPAAYNTDHWSPPPELLIQYRRA